MKGENCCSDFYCGDAKLVIDSFLEWVMLATAEKKWLFLKSLFFESKACSYGLVGTKLYIFRRI
jgi:hypothetical protein